MIDAALALHLRYDGHEEEHPVPQPIQDKPCPTIVWHKTGLNRQPLVPFLGRALCGRHRLVAGSPPAPLRRAGGRG